MNTATPRVVIVGAGHAGGSLAGMLRQYGFTGSIVMIGEEAAAPYQRPPLSKAYLKGEINLSTLTLRPDAFYAQHNIETRYGLTVTAIDPTGKTFTLKDGRVESYDFLILATGSRARKLTIPGAELKNVHALRTLADADALKAVLKPGAHIAIIGGGYIGLEVAASARGFGAAVTILEREARVLARVACVELSSFFERYHRDKGVEIVTDANVTRFVGDDSGAVKAVEVNGKLMPCEAAVVGIGAEFRDELARAAGLKCERGIVVDAAARTSDPNIFAIGDVTWRPMPLYGNRMWKLESVPNALEQAKQAACAIAGKPQPAPEVPWFWSDQYDLKFQIVGVPFDADQIVIRGDRDAGKFAVFHLKAGRVMAVEAVNAPSEFVIGKQLIAKGTVVDVGRLTDASIPMRELVA